jgi:alanine-glyoxylate transaminase/serine-glyoxylate transaminase/serine-pyruvate transaminase
MVAPRVYAAMGKPIVGYLDPYCFQVIEEIQAGLRKVFGTNNEFTIPISGTGSAGMEAAVANFSEPGQTFATFVNGFFPSALARWRGGQGARLVRLRSRAKSLAIPKRANLIQREHPSVVAYVQAETSTAHFSPAKPSAKRRTKPAQW